jgi:hypothetical protein
MRKVLIPLLLSLSSPAYAGDLVQQFKNPAFSGVNWTAQVLSIEAEERARKQALVDARNSAAAQAKADAANTPLARFVSLFTSQVYAQLATQLSNNLFSGTSQSNSGNFVLDGNTISYIKSGTSVTLTIVDERGNQTVVTVPIATFAF